MCSAFLKPRIASMECIARRLFGSDRSSLAVVGCIEILVDSLFILRVSFALSLSLSMSHYFNNKTIIVVMTSFLTGTRSSTTLFF